MASRVPVSGSAYVYSMKIFGECAAVITGINLLFDYHIGAALIARNLVHYIVRLLEGIGVPTLPTWISAIPIPSLPFLSLSFTAPLILFGLAAVLCCGIKESAQANNILTSLKMFIVVFIVVAGCTAVDAKNWEPFAPKGVSSVFQASSLVFFAYIGFDAVCNTAEECISPETTLPFGIVVSLFICALLYAGRYFKRRRACIAYMESTVVDISIPPPIFQTCFIVFVTYLLLSLKTPQTSLFF